MRQLVLALGCALLLVSCTDTPGGPGADNLAPETHLSLVPDSTLRTTPSRQHLHWWGDDPDGLVRGYFVSLDGATWSFTTKNDSVFALTLSGTDSAYVFRVRAVDDQGNGVYDPGEPYSDTNKNGVRDAAESFTDLGLADPTPAELRIPVRNSPPVVQFVKGSDVPDTTFPVASFAWTGTDLDGDESIREYRYALNDTVAAASWKTLPRSQTFLTLFARDGIREGANVFYIKAVDIAGAESRIVRMPAEGDVWQVRLPRTELLIVDDYGPIDETGQFYRTITDTLLGGRFRNADVLDVRAGATSTKKGVNVPPYINPTFIETLKLFKHVIWYSDNNPTLDLAQLSLPQYQQAGGTVLYTASFPESAVDPRGGITDFTPVDSIAPVPIQFIPMNTPLEPDTESPGYPQLKRDTRGQPVAFVRGLSRKINARNLYRLGSDTRWQGNPVVAVRSGDKRFVLFSIPLNRFDGLGNTGDVISRIFTQEFGAR